MPFLAVGVEHGTTPLSVRENLALDPDAIARISAELSSQVPELVILSTCNRVELYLYAEEDGADDLAIRALDPDGTFAPYIRRWEEREAIEHLFRVSSGLESQILGEQQILGQVRDAYELAQQHDTVGPNLHALFRAAISCARQARAGSNLGRVRPSVAAAAIKRAEAVLEPLSGRAVLLIGAGEVIRGVAEELRRRDLQLYVANRTVSAALEIAARADGRAATLRDLPRLLPHVDLVISATGAPYQVLVAEDVLPRSRPLTIIDLAVPRDVDPGVATLPGVTVYDLEDILPEAGRWEEDIRTMEGVIAAEVQEFIGWTLTRRIVPVIANLRSHVEAVSEQELQRVAPQLANLDERERAAVDSLTHRLIDKMFHHLVTRLRLAAQTDPALVEAAEFFFLHGEGGLFEHAAEIEKTRERT